MKQKLLLLMLFCCTIFVFQSTKAQTLAPGDIAFIGYNTADPDGFTFIALKTLPAGETLYFTEQGWTGTAWAAGSNVEPHLQWIIPSGVTAGTIVSLVETAVDDVFTITGSSNPFTFAYSSGFNLSGGDQIIAYQSTTTVRPASPIFIAAIHGDYNSGNYNSTTTWNNTTIFSGSESVLPTGLTNGIDCISLFPGTTEMPYSKYTGTLTGTSEALKLSINNPANWSHNSTTHPGLLPSNYPTPNISLSTITFTPSSLSGFSDCPDIPSATQTLTVSGTSLTAGILVSAPTGFQVSTSTGGPFTPTLTVPQSSGSITNVPVYVRLNASTSGAHSGNITLSSTGATNKTVAVSGTITAPPTITANPANSTICAGANTTFSVTANNATSYQWQVDTGSGYGNITNGGVYSGATTATLTITGATAGMNGYKYKALPIGTCTAVGYSNEATLTVNNAPAITSQPSASTICAGANTTFSVVASNATGYQWQYDNGSGYQNVPNNATYSGATTATLTITSATAGLNGYLYRVTATGCTPNAISNGVALTINSAPAITAQPSASTICAGANTTFSATASNATGYQWQVDQGAGFSNVPASAPYSGTTSATLTITAATAGLNGFIYRVRATGICTPDATSNSAALTVNTAPAITTQPSASTICAGANTTFSVAASNATGYQWQYDNGSGYQNVPASAPYSGTTSATLTITGATAGLNGFIYRAIASGICTPNATSNGAALTVNSAPSITTQPSNAITCPGATSTFTVVASNATGYQWQVNQGAGFFNIPIIAPYSGANTATLTITSPTAGMNGYVYRVSVSGICTPAATSSARTLTIANILSVGSQTDVSCNGGSNGTASVSTPTGGTAPYSYLWSNGATSSSITGLTAGSYTCTITDANGCTKTVTVPISQPSLLTLTQGTMNNVSCNGGSNGSAIVVVTGGITPYTYDWNGTPIGDGTASISGLAAGTYTVTVTDNNSCSKTLDFIIAQPTLTLSATTTKTDVSCNNGSNGSATAVPAGGTAPYTYSWSPTGGAAITATGLGAGTYTVTVTDSNSCTTTATATIGQPTTALSATTTKTNVSCNGGNNGTATAIPAGGTAPYTYSWSPSGGTAITATGLDIGTYTVTVTDAKGCFTTATATIGQPALALSATTTKTDVSCNGGANGTATVTTMGGTGTKSYSWSPSGGTAATATGLSAGTYTVTVTDSNSCTTTATATIGQPTTALSATTTKTDVSCNGGTNGTTTAVPAGGTAPYTYSWAPSGGTAITATGLAIGTYTVTVTDSKGCITTATANVGQPTVLSATTTKVDVSCNGGTNGSATAIPAGGTAPYTYSWSPTGGAAATATGLGTGTYVVTVTDNNGCTTTASATIGQPTVLSATTTKTDVSCNGGANGSATAVPAGGTAPYTYSWSPSGGTAITATGLAIGTYTVTVTDAKGCFTTATATIGQPATALSATTTKTDVSCNGSANGTATAVPAGGTAPYTYSWSPSGGTAITATGLAIGTYTVTVTDAKGCFTTATATIGQPATALSATTTKVDVSCNGGTNGSATAVPAGGTAPYTYSWSPSGGTAATATGLATGTYTVTVTDAKGCTTTAIATVGQPTALSATTTKVDVSCNGGTNGSATAVPAGGTAPYTYSWSPTGGAAATATGLGIGTYTVTVTDAKGCTTTASATIGQPTTLSATTTKIDVACNGGATGSATVTATGGTPTYTYSWSPSGGTAATATGLAIGTYTVTVTDSKGCFTTATATIGQPATALSATTAKVDVSCNGGTNGSATVTAAGGSSPYTYSWSPSGGSAATASGLGAGTYTVTVMDSKGCTTTATAVIGQPASALSATTAKVDVSCNGGTNGSATVTATGGTSPYTYSWSPTGGAAATATGLGIGTYTVTVTDAKGCFTTATATIGQPVVLSATTTKVDVSCNGGTNGSATVTAVGGTSPYTYSWSPSGGTAATATGLATGTYTVTVTDAKGCTTTATATVGQPATALSATTTKVDVSCNGGATGSATVTAAGGTSPYTYSWSSTGGTNATTTGRIAGTYTVTVTDAKGCTTTATAVIGQPATALAATTTKVDVSCNGGANGSATVTATGGTAPYTYSWSPTGGTGITASGRTAGTYTVTVTDAKGCTTTATAIIGQPATALSATTTKEDVACNGGANGLAIATATGGTAPYTYSWSSGDTENVTSGLVPGTYTVTVTDAKGCTTTATAVISQPTTALSATTTNTSVLCNGGATGTATVTAAGGTAPYTYSWSPAGGTAITATGLAAGTYTVTVTDANGCTTTATATITEPAILTATITKIDVACNAGVTGSATVTALGGTAPYTYEWSGGGGTNATTIDVIAGDYTVTITDANGCTTTSDITITQPLAITITTNPENVSILTDGTAMYTINSTNADSFQWQVTTNGTDWTDIVDGGTEPTYSGATTSTLTINDIPVTFDNYQYRVLLTNGIDCVTTSTFALLTVNNGIQAVNDDFSATVINQGVEGVAGDVTANDLLNNVAVNDADVIIAVVNDGGLTGVTIDAVGSLTVPATATLGTYTVTYSICEVGDTTNCSSAEAIVVVSPPLGREDFKTFNVSVYPNPATTEVFIKIPEFATHPNIKITVYDMNGRIVKESRVTTEIQTIDVSNLEAGIYNFNIVSDNGTTTKRIVKNK